MQVVEAPVFRPRAPLTCVGSYEVSEVSPPTVPLISRVCVCVCDKVLHLVLCLVRVFLVAFLVMSKVVSCLVSHVSRLSAFGLVASCGFMWLHVATDIAFAYLSSWR